MAEELYLPGLPTQLAEELGHCHRLAQRISIILEESIFTPKNSALEVENAVVLRRQRNILGYQSVWYVLRKQCIVVVGQMEDGNRVIHDVRPLAVH